MNKNELRKVSLLFRTKSSQMLKVSSDEEVVYIRAFYNFITETSILHNYILSCHRQEYNFDDILKNLGFSNRLGLPVEPSDLIDYEYQLLQYLLNGKKDLYNYGYHYTKSNNISDMISAFIRKVIEPFVVELRSYLEMRLIDADDDETNDSSEERTIFLSYCQKDFEIADLVEKKLAEKLDSKIRITRDVRDVAYHQSFGKFMQTIQDHDYVILLISDRYLKSRNCMYEVTQAIKDSRYKKKVVYIVLQEEDKAYISAKSNNKLGADVYSSDGQVQYIQFWKEEEKKLQEQIKSIGDPAYSIGQAKEDEIVKRIRLELPEFFNFLRDNKGLSLVSLLEEDFQSMIGFMGF